MNENLKKLFGKKEFLRIIERLIKNVLFSEEITPNVGIDEEIKRLSQV